MQMGLWLENNVGIKTDQDQMRSPIIRGGEGNENQGRSGDNCHKDAPSRLETLGAEDIDDSGWVVGIGSYVKLAVVHHV